MSVYLDYLAEIESRKIQGLAPKPIDDGGLVFEIIGLIRDAASEHRADALVSEQMRQVGIRPFLPGDFSKLRPADGGVVHLHQYLPDAERRHLDVIDDERLIQFRENGGFHGPHSK